MSELSKTARASMRDKASRLVNQKDGKVDASDWSPPEPLRAGRKVYDQSKERKATAKIYKHGGKVQSDRGPRRLDKKSRIPCADGGVPVERLTQNPVGKSAFMPMKRGGEARTGNRKDANFLGGTRPTGGRIARAGGGRAKGKGKTNIVINVGGQGQPPMPPPQAPTRPPMAPPPPMPMGPPPGGPPGMAGGPPIPPPSMAGPGGPPMMRKRGGRTGDGKVGIDVPMKAGAGGGLGRLEKIKQYGAGHRS